MSTLATRLTDLATRIATECKSLRNLVNGNAADLSGLTTTAKGNLVAAVNEVNAAVGAVSAGAPIDDAGALSGAKTWSSTKISTSIAAGVTSAINSVTNGAASALDTLAEIAAALGNDGNFAATMTTSLSNRVRVDAVQGFTAGQKTQACVNLGIGEPDTDFVATFNAALT